MAQICRKRTKTYNGIISLSVRKISSNAVKANFIETESTESWLSKQPIAAIKSQFDTQGFAVIHDIVDTHNLSIYQNFYNKMLNGTIDASAHRHDLGNNEEQHLENIENVTQIMWPSEYISNLQSEGPFHQRAEAIAKILLYEDHHGSTAFDFDMMLYKASNSSTSVPWHQDAAYWPFEINQDITCCSFWCALDNAYIENGCMWFLPRSKQELLHQFNHRNASKHSHVQMIDDEAFDKELNGKYDGGIAVPLKAGSATVHNGRTPHHTKGNTMDRSRRALVACYRSKEMIDYERSIGFDHGKSGLDGNALSKEEVFEAR